MKHRTKSKLSKKQKSQLNNLRKWVVKERRRLRLPNEPKFSYSADSYTNKIQLCYSIPYQDGFNEKGKPNVKRKQKKKYTFYTLDTWKDIQVRNDYDDIKNEYDIQVGQIYLDESSLDYWIKKYLTPNRKGTRILADSSIKSDEFFLTEFHKWIKEHRPNYNNIWTWTEDGERVLEDYLQYKQKHGGSRKRPWNESTLHNGYTRIKGMFNWISYKDKTYPSNVIGKLDIPNPKPQTFTFTDREMDKVKSFMSEYEDNISWSWFVPILRVLLTTGCRISEAVGMRIDDLDFDERKWRIIGKGNKHRTIRFKKGEKSADKCWSEILKHLVDDNGEIIDKEFVFHFNIYRKPNKDGRGGGWKELTHKHYNQSGVQHKFRTMVKMLKLNPKLTPHACRRYFITQMLLQTNGSIPLVSQVVGHESWEMVHHYTKSLIKEDTKMTLDL
jgi:integrase